MSVTNTTTLVATAGDGAETEFDFAFKIFAETDLVVYKKSAAGVYTLQTLTTNYTVEFDTEAETGTVTFLVAPVGSGGGALILRATSETQDTSFPREGLTPSKTIENAIDKLTLLVQEMQERLDRAPLQPAYPPNPAAIIVEAPEDGAVLRWRIDAGVPYIESDATI